MGALSWEIIDKMYFACLLKKCLLKGEQPFRMDPISEEVEKKQKQGVKKVVSLAKNGS